MNWLFDRPVSIAIVGLMLCVPIAIGWVMSGRKEMLYSLAVAFALFVGLLIMERVVVTDREALEATVGQIARDVQANDHQAVQRHIYSGSPQLNQKVQAEMPNYKFIECRITSQPVIEVNAQAEPRSAKVSFLAAAAGDFKYEGMTASAGKEAPIRRRIILKMKKEADGRWAVEDYDHEDFTKEFINKKVE
ncbi:MAG: hypothetical protein K8R36_04410 [Planctomycetales bacterium]|nr:hypothetical protein [Planctomycetales bacterium]